MQVVTFSAPVFREEYRGSTRSGKGFMKDESLVFRDYRHKNRRIQSKIPSERRVEGCKPEYG